MRAAGLPNQDAVEVRPFVGGGVVAAVADGHGHARHFRSARGARLAVSIACQAVCDLAARPDGLPVAPEELRHLLVPGIVTQWRDAVHRDVAAEPFTGAEDAVRRGDDATIPYGTTLLVAMGTGERLLLAQIGDGDIVCVPAGRRGTAGGARRPAARQQAPPRACASPGASDSFRVATVDLAGTAVLGALLATDGYGNAQVAQVWESVVSAELAGLIATRPVSWMASQLQAQAGQCASVDGSADDTTLALLLAPAATQNGRPLRCRQWADDSAVSGGRRTAVRPPGKARMVNGSRCAGTASDSASSRARPSGSGGARTTTSSSAIRPCPGSMPSWPGARMGGCSRAWAGPAPSCAAARSPGCSWQSRWS